MAAQSTWSKLKMLLDEADALAELERNASVAAQDVYVRAVHETCATAEKLKGQIVVLNPDVPRANLVHVSTDYFESCDSWIVPKFTQLVFVTTHDPAARVRFNAIETTVGASTFMIVLQLLDYNTVTIVQPSGGFPAAAAALVCEYCNLPDAAMPALDQYSFRADVNACHRFANGSVIVYGNGCATLVAEDQTVDGYYGKPTLAPEHVAILRTLDLALSDSAGRQMADHHDTWARYARQPEVRARQRLLFAN